MTRHEAYIEKNWEQHGLAPVFVGRIRDNGSADFALFLVDVWCLGIKDTYVEIDAFESDLRAFVEERLPEAMREPISPACAKKLIDGALAYAERLGFAPHRDFRKARRVLSGLDATQCPTPFTYGRDGRPCYVRGPHDSAERVERILAILEARLGPDGFDYEGVEDDPDDDMLARRTELMDWLDAEPEEVPRFYTLSGMVTAAFLGSQPVSPSDIVKALWEPTAPIWSNQDDLEAFLDLLIDYWNDLSDMVLDATAPDAPSEAQVIDVWLEDFPKGKEIYAIAAMAEWAAGFYRVIERYPEAWAEALNRADLAEHWEIVRWWTNFLENKDRIDAAAQAAPPRNLGLSVAALARALRRPNQAPS